MDLITTSYDITTTADEVIAGVDLTGLRAIVTGASSGIGVETARSLARAGAEVTLAVRDVPAGQRVADDITATTGNHRVPVVHLDLVDGLPGGLQRGGDRCQRRAGRARRTRVGGRPRRGGPAVGHLRRAAGDTRLTAAAARGHLRSSAHLVTRSQRAPWSLSWPAGPNAESARTRRRA
ncbi:MAG: SDR family NAD(P)-dependent oxidoreductase [Nocardioidaceae bacterium]|nr:SDR family NAD(P)-dependent oxidoreductase [Nocardioidaceae bacterium]